MNDLRITVTVKNGLMLRVMERAGYWTAADLWRACGVSQVVIGDYLGLKLAPYRQDGSLRPSILTISGTLKCLPEDLFPAVFLHQSLSTNRVTREVSSADVPGLLMAADDNERNNPERLAMVNEAVAALTAEIEGLAPREQRILNMLYGLDGARTMTLDEVARVMGVGRERIRQIALKGQRKLRHQKRNLRSRCAVLLDAPA